MAIRRDFRSRHKFRTRTLGFEALDQRQMLAILTVGPEGDHATIQAAVNHAAPGDTIRLVESSSAVTFVESVNLSLMGSARPGGVQTGNLTIMGDSEGAGTTISTDGGSTFFNSQPFVGDLRFESLTLRPATQTAGDDIGINLNGVTGNITIRRVNVHDAADVGVQIVNSGGPAGTQSVLTIDALDVSRVLETATPIGMRLQNLQMTGSVNDVRITDVSDVGITVETSGVTQTSLTFSVFFIIGAGEVTPGKDGIRISATGSSSLTVNMSEGNFNSLPGNSISAVVANSAHLITNIYGQTAFDNLDELMVRLPNQPAVRFVANNSARLSLAIENNIFTSIAGDGIQIQANDTTRVNTRIHNNFMTNIGSAAGFPDGHEAIHIIGNPTSNATVNAMISLNDIFDSFGSSIRISGSGRSTYNVRLIDNSIRYDIPFSAAAAGIEIHRAVTVTSTENQPKVNLAIEGNVVESSVPNTNIVGLRVAQGNPSFELKFEFDTPTLAEYLQTHNIMTTSLSIFSTQSTLRAPLGAFLGSAPVMIGDFVWLDENKNGLQDAGEQGVHKALLILNGTETASGATVNLRVVSDEQGGYMFGAIMPGSYTVTIVPPAGLDLTWLKRTTPNPNDNNDEFDSDFRYGIRQTNPITLAPGQSNNNVDAGLIPTNGRVWHNQIIPEDVDGNGFVTPLDALLIIIELNANGPRVLPAPTAAFTPTPFLDVSGNGTVAPLDALLVIIRLNAGAIGGAGEAPAAPLMTGQEGSSSSALPAAVGEGGDEEATMMLPPDWFYYPPLAAQSTEDEDEVGALDAFFADVGQ